MANFGKIFPAALVGRVYLYNPDYRPYPPMWYRLKTDGGSTGTVAAQWRNLDLLSEEKFRLSSASIVEVYRWIHPTVPTLSIELHARFEAQAPGVLLPAHPAWWCSWYAYDSSGLVASDDERKLTADGSFHVPIATGNPTNFWSNRPNLAKWTQFTAQGGAARWADVPGFHPYRH